ncbi:hypothetical protein, partial [Prevotella bivia]|uniref:hypothetical protein n=1 Tax=Prevotella bivia TaxID=28125 RepID=UPI0007DF1ECE
DRVGQISVAFPTDKQSNWGIFSWNTKIIDFGKAATRICPNSAAILCVLVALLTLHRKMKADGRLLNNWKLCPRA